MGYGYAYAWGFGSFDFGSAIPCIELAVQSLGTTYQGDDGKYYQTDEIGARDGEIRFGGRGVFDGTREAQISANSGNYPSIKFTIDGTVGLNVLSRGVSSEPTDIVIGMSGTSLRFFYYNTLGSPKILTILDYNTVYGSGKHEIEYKLTDMGSDTTMAEIYVDGDLYISVSSEDSIPSYNGDIYYIGSRIGDGIGTFDMPDLTICNGDGEQVFKSYFENFDQSILYDISDEGNHGTLTSGSEIGFQTQEEGIYSYWDNYGGNYVSPNYIPALESNTDIDVLGNTNENKGRVKYPNEQWSSCLTTDGSTNYLDTEYYPNGDTVFIFKGSFDVVKANNYIGCGDTANDKRLYFGITTASGNNFIFGAGAFTTSDYPYDLEPHTFIVCARGEFFVLPIETDISTPAKVKDILDNTTPNGTSSGFTTASIQPIYLGGLSALGVFANTTNFESQILEYDGTDITLIDKWGFSEYDGAYVYSLADGFDLEILGSLVDVWDLSPYAYPRNNTLGFGIAGDAFIPIELGGSCLVMNGTDNSISINESCGLGYDEDFHYIFGFSLSESTNYYECLFNIQSDTYYGGSMFLYVKYGDIPEFRIMKKVNSSYLTYTLSFPDELPRDGSKISGFVKKEGSIITMGFNGVEVSADFPGEAPAYENDIITIGTSDSGMSSAFLTGKLFYLDIAPSFKSTFSDFSGSTIENRYEDKSAGILSGSLLNAWEISKLAVTYTGTNIGLNGSESEYKDPYVFELIEACNSLAPNFRFSDTESLLWGYDDIEGNVQDLNFMFSDVNTNTPVKDNTTTYSEALTGDCLAKANEYFKTT